MEHERKKSVRSWNNEFLKAVTSLDLPMKEEKKKPFYHHRGESEGIKSHREQKSIFGHLLERNGSAERVKDCRAMKWERWKRYLPRVRARATCVCARAVGRER